MADPPGGSDARAREVVTVAGRGIEMGGGREFAGRSVDEARDAGLSELGLRAEEADVAVLDPGSRGFLGLGARPARVRVQPGARTAAAVGATAAEVLRLMGLEAGVRTERDGATIRVLIEGGRHDGLLIGRKGETLAALEYVLTRMATRRGGGEELRIEVDIAGYRQRRGEQLARLAVELAERVERTGRRAMTEPLSASDRRVVHRALADNPRVVTHAAGDGPARRIVITPPREGRGARPR